MNKIKICIFIRSLELGGAEKQSQLLHKYLSKYYSTYLVVYVANNLGQPIYSDENIILLNGNAFSKIFQFYKFIKTKKITHIFNYLPLNNIVGIIVGRLAGVKYLYGGIRGVKIKNKYKMIVTKYLCNYVATKFISNSFAAKDNYSLYGLKKEKIEVIHNAIEKTEFRKKDHKHFTILIVGRFSPEKDYETAIKSIKALLQLNQKNREEIRVKIIGYGKLSEHIQNQIRIENLADIIDLNSDGSIGESYTECDLLLNTSSYEGMPNVVMEAMNHSLPIIATDAGDTRYLVIDGYNGFICPIKDPDYIAARLNDILSNKEKARIMGMNSYRIIDEIFRPNKVFSSYLELIIYNVS